MNGQEKDDEIASGIYGALFWEYDSRLGRRWNLDPKPEFGISQYACFADNPISNADPLGDRIKPKGSDEDKKAFVADLNKGQEGVAYKIGKKGRIEIDKDNTTVTSDKYNSFTKTITGAIDSKNNIKLNLIRGDRDVLFDDFNSAKVDLNDLDKADKPFQLATIAHFIAERNAVKNYNFNRHFISTTRSDGAFVAAHNVGLGAERNVMSEQTGIGGLGDRTLIDSRILNSSKHTAQFKFSYGKGLIYTLTSDYIPDKNNYIRGQGVI